MSASPDPGRPAEGPVSPPRLNFRENVERLRCERGHSTQALTSRSDLDPAELTELLRGERKVEVDVIYLLAGALDVGAEVLLEGIEWQPPAAGGSGWTITGGGQDG
ncbi:MAG: helix-turn-helix transcriptional regulator [Actinobacteria bacterium]|nr:helix-turn-helix transcriptional regulator [Actinomycetota bacterium]